MKAQISMEFTIVFSILIVVFLVIFVYTNERNSELDSNRKYLSAKSLADKIAASINQVFLSSYGTKKTVYLPDKLTDNIDYNLSVYPTARVVEIIWVSIDRRQYTSPIITSNINAASLTSGEVNIMNTNGAIKVE